MKTEKVFNNTELLLSTWDLKCGVSRSLNPLLGKFLVLISWRAIVGRDLNAHLGHFFEMVVDT